MKPLTQNMLLASLAVVSLATAGLVLILGQAKSAASEANQPAATVHVHQNGPAGQSLSDSWGSASSELPDDYGHAPSFALTNQAGKPVTLDSFKGKAIICSFIFTRCQGPCPLITAHMAELQSQIEKRPDRDKIALVSFSVDPSYDTPKVLTEYAGKFKADPAIWSFLTGGREAMWQVVGQGFHLGIKDQPENKTSPILHSTRLILIDSQGKIRGYYHALEQDSRAKLMKQLGQVLDEKSGSGEGHL